MGIFWENMLEVVESKVELPKIFEVWGWEKFLFVVWELEPKRLLSEGFLSNGLNYDLLPEAFAIEPNKLFFSALFWPNKFEDDDLLSEAFELPITVFWPNSLWMLSLLTFN